jgi:HD-like signal output (HDOD) protein
MKAEDYAQQAQGSFTVPDVCLKVRELIEDDSSTMEDFANLISVDPSLTSHLLKMANSAIYCFPGEISTISRAITIIGTQAIYTLMLVDLASSAFRHFQTDAIDNKRFWHYSVFCALATKNIAIKAGVRDIERLFVAGLLQNIGELIVARQTPELIPQCQKFSADVLPWEVQNQVLGFSYTDISAELLKQWGIPEKIILPIRHFNQARGIQLNKDVKVLYLSSRLALTDCFPDYYHSEDLIDLQICKDLQVEKEDIEDAIFFAKQETMNILSIMQASFY